MNKIVCGLLLAAIWLLAFLNLFPHSLWLGAAIATAILVVVIVLWPYARGKRPLR